VVTTVVVSSTASSAASSALLRLVEQAWAVLNTVPDPEIPVISIVELGVVRAVEHVDNGILVSITPTYAGCPALEQMRSDALAALTAAGIPATLKTVLSPAWSGTWLNDATREKLRVYGIAPPHLADAKDVAKPKGLQFLPPSGFSPACPQCNSRRTERLSEFGSTACKALYRCTACLEPFDYFKPY
jgi:ring-1,2-phenylacetyl-CoA epoxidase subunit PaaD